MLHVESTGDDLLTSTVALTPTVQEESVRFTVASAALVGNLTVPAEPRDVGIVFVHGWSGNRSGPHGLITTLARALAQAGYPSLRFDFRGRGESEGEGLAASLSTMATDLTGATTFMQQRCGAKRIVLFGICSGGNVAIGTLPQLQDVAGLVLLSVYPFSDGDAFSRDVHRTWHYAREYWRKAMRPDTWKRLVRGDVHVAQVFNVLFGHFLRKRKKKGFAEPAKPKASAPSREESRLSDKPPPKKYLVHLSKQTPALMVYGAADPDAKAGRDYFEAYAQEHDLPVEFVEIPDANHNFSSVAWTSELAALALAFCDRTCS